MKQYVEGESLTEYMAVVLKDIRLQYARCVDCGRRSYELEPGNYLLGVGTLDTAINKPCVCNHCLEKRK